MEKQPFTVEDVQRAISLVPEKVEFQETYLEQIGIQVGEQLYDIPTGISVRVLPSLSTFLLHHNEWYLQMRHASENNPMEFANILVGRLKDLRRKPQTERSTNHSHDPLEYHSGVMTGFAHRALDHRDFPPAIHALVGLKGPALFDDVDSIMRLEEAIRESDNPYLRMIVAFQIAQELNGVE